MHLTMADYEALKHRDTKKIVPGEVVVESGWVKATAEAAQQKPSKYRAIMEECDGIKFQSKKEAKYYRELCCRIRAGEVRYFLRQVPFHLIGGVVYRVDFMEVHKDSSIHYIDVKGFRTQTYKNKRKQVQSSYPVLIEEA